MSHFKKALEEGKEGFKQFEFATCPTDTEEPFFWKWNEHGSEMIEIFLTQFAEKIRQAVAEDDVEWAEGKKKENILVAENEYSRGMQFGVSATLTEIITHKREQLTKE